MNVEVVSLVALLVAEAAPLVAEAGSLVAARRFQ